MSSRTIFSLDRLTHAQQAEAMKQLHPKSHAQTTPHSSQVPDPQPKRHKTPALGGTAEREEAGMVRTCVRFVGYRVRPLDPDNFAASCKDLLDGLRHSSLIQGDEPWRIILETEQVKVGRFADERTEITITYPQ